MADNVELIIVLVAADVLAAGAVLGMLWYAAAARGQHLREAEQRPKSSEAVSANSSKNRASTVRL